MYIQICKFKYLNIYNNIYIYIYIYIKLKTLYMYKYINFCWVFKGLKETDILTRGNKCFVCLIYIYMYMYYIFDIYII